MSVTGLTGAGRLGDAWLSDFAEVAVGGLLKLADPSPVCVRGCADRLALLANSSCHRMAAARERSAWVICNTHAGEAYCPSGEGPATLACCSAVLQFCC